MLRELLSMNYSTVTGISFKHYCTSGIELVSNLNTCFLLAVHAKQAVEPMYKVKFESHLKRAKDGSNPRRNFRLIQIGAWSRAPARFQSLLSFIYGLTQKGFYVTPCYQYSLSFIYAGMSQGCAFPVLHALSEVFEWRSI
jgi:hypothetical protein